MAKKNDLPSIKTTHETRLLKCELTVEEVRVAAQELARNLDELEALDDKRKEVVADFKAQIEAKEAAAKVQRNLVRNKYDYRNTACTMELNYTEGKVIVTRDDTHEIVTERKMMAEERQSNMGFDGNEKAA